MCVCVQIRLRNAVPGALEDDGHAVDVESLVSEKMPGDLP